MATSKDNAAVEPATPAVPAEPAKTTTRRKPVKAKPEIVAEAPPVETVEVDTTIAEAKDQTPVETDPTTADEVKTDENIADKAEYEFFEELPNKQQAAPVVAKAESNPDTRITKAIEGSETEPEKVEADKAFDLETQQTPAIDGRPEPEPAPAEVDQPEIIGVSTTTNVLPTGTIEEGETEPEKLDSAEEVFAEGTSPTLEPNPGRVGGEGRRYDPEAYNAASSEQPEIKRPKPKKTTNPKLRRLNKYKAA